MWKLRIAEGDGPWLRTKNSHVGRQTWEFDPKLGTPEEIAEVEKAREAFRESRFEKKHSSDLLMRLQFAKENPLDMDYPVIKLQDHEDVTEEVVLTSLRRAMSRTCVLQAHDGHWPGDFGGPLFFLPGLIITLHVTGALSTVLTHEHQKEIRRYLYNHQNRDGGWGFHIEGESTMFGSAMVYVGLRLLGEDLNGGDGAMEKGRKWILDHGSATAITSWGKMWLSVLGVFDWSGNNPLPPEMWLLPYFVPFHPGLLASAGKGITTRGPLELFGVLSSPFQVHAMIYLAGGIGVCWIEDILSFSLILSMKNACKKCYRALANVGTCICTF